MKIISGYKELKNLKEDTTIAIGNFDGLHLGHQKILELAKIKSYDKNYGILTFNPHPKEYFDKIYKKKDFKIKILDKLGLSFYIELPFDKKLSSLSAEDFCNKILINDLKIKNVIVGQDFKFGKGREGNVKVLKNLGKKNNFNVLISETVSVSKTNVSSTLIRNLLSEGDVNQIKKCLGRWHCFYGEVIDGDKRGRELGFPTINLDFENLYIPKFGIYSSIIEIETGENRGLYKGVVSIGKRPTFGKNTPNFEAHLLDFNKNIYGEKVIVSLTHFQRPELKFDSSESLITQMKKDCEIAKKNLQKI